MTTKADVDGAELHVCVDLGDGVCESTGGEGPDAERTAREAIEAGAAIGAMFSVYWHLRAGGVECVADFNFDDAGREGARLLRDAMEAWAK